MNQSRQFILGLITALVSVAIVLGALSISLAESGGILSPTRPTTPAPTNTAVKVIIPSVRVFTSTPLVATLIPNPACPIPAGWVAYTVAGGDTLASIADKFKVDAGQLERANCLLTNAIKVGDTLYVPAPPPTATPTVTPTPTSTVTATATPVPTRPVENHPNQPTLTPVPACGPPAGWVTYVVQSGDTLFRLSSELGVNISQLQRANCMGSSTTLHTGSSIYVPHRPVRTPTRTPTVRPSSTPRPKTPTPQPTDTPSEPEPPVP
jgi:LysM repeat protein